MRIRPRQELLEIWRAIAQYSVRDTDDSTSDKGWVWDGREGRNSISDAEQLLCIMLPATQVEPFGLDQPDDTADDILRALRRMGDAVEIPRMLIKVIGEYFDRYTDSDGTPVFSGASYFDTSRPESEPTEEQLSLDIVDSYAMSVRLALAVVGFLRVLRNVVRSTAMRLDIDRLEDLASKRLSAAMVGMLRSFTVSTFEAGSEEGMALIRTANQAGIPERKVVTELRRALRQTMAAFREMTIGSGQSTEELEYPNKLFECGWSWGIVKDAPTIETTEKVGQQVDGVATDKPYLYFTVIAVDAIEDLFSERTRILNLLNEEQQRLSRALQLRWELTRAYWATVAMFGDGQRWPLEDIPWRTTDEVESDYLSLLVTSLVVHDLVPRRGSDAELARVGLVLTELGNRGRITRRPFADDDSALRLHLPGVSFDLLGSESRGGPQLAWLATDFAPLLLQRTVRIAGLINDTDRRASLLELADRVWDHLADRRFDAGPARSLWDQPADVFPQLPARHQLPSWYYTVRVVLGVVGTARVLFSNPLRSPGLTDFALELLSEAEHLFDQELLSRPVEFNEKMRATFTTISAQLRRARDIVQDRPGTATALATDVLRGIDALAVARGDVERTD
ncbi:MAG TPA: SCO2524 family protein [Rugosimonospora sp.]|nr:SCO2524 family protein [Rugosimonospora sp.]